MKHRRYTKLGGALCAAALLAALLAGCGGNASSAVAYSAAEYTPAATPYVGEEMMATEGGSAQVPLGQPQEGRKIVLNAYVSMETKTLDETLAALQQAIAQADGKISASSLRGGQGETRSATITAKIPAANYSEFMQKLGESGNVTSRDETSEDITAQYVDVEARLSALRTQEKRLLELMEQAGDLSDLLQVQEQLTQVQYQIESYTATQRTYDNMVDYSTVNLTVQEVKDLTVTPEAYGSRIAAAFRQGWAAAGAFFQNLGLAIAGAAPLLLVLGVAAAVLVVLLRRRRKKRRVTKPAPPAAPPEDGGEPPSLLK